MSKHIKTRINFIEADEVLLPVLKWRDDKHVIMESGEFGKQYRSAAYFICEFDDDVVQILRFSLSAMKATDVTEEIAEEYLEDYNEDPQRGVTLEDEPFFPLYVRRSLAWARWKDDLEAERQITGPDDKRIDLRDRRYDATQVEGARL